TPSFNGAARDRAPNDYVDPGRGDIIDWLQWGGARSRAECPASRAVERRALRLASMGRRAIARRMRELNQWDGLGAALLKWGGARSRAECLRRPYAERTDALASMGRRAIARRMCASAIRANASLTAASMGRRAIARRMHRDKDVANARQFALQWGGARSRA